jgi:putative ABC transport system substrate-binding protein
MTRIRLDLATLGLVLLCVHAEPIRSQGLARIGVITPAPASAQLEAALREGLRQFGYSEGKNISFEWRRSSGTSDDLHTLAVTLTGARVDVIVAVGTPEARAALSATASIPVVFMSGDPLGAGLVRSLAKPGANATGISLFSPDLTAKRLEFLHQLAPRAKRIAHLGNPFNPVNALHLTQAKKVADALGLTLETFDARDKEELEIALDAIRRYKPDGLLVSPDLLLVAERARVAEFVRRSRILAVFPVREFHEHNVLISYGYNIAWATSRTAGYVHKILSGATPSDLPVEQLTQFELVVNTNVARSMGINIPESLLVRADEVIR